MISLRSIKMEKARGIFITSREIKEARIDLEKKTEKAFNDYARNKQNARARLHKTHLD